MAITQNTFNGDGSNLGPFSFTFKWLEPTDIKVTVSGVLKTAGTHYNLQSLNYTTKSGGQVLFTAGNAPAVGTGNIVIYRQTDDNDLSATFNSGSAIRAQDLNDNFIQGLYVTQESSNNSATATAAANAATTTANTALSNSTAAQADATSALSTANAASAAAASAVSTANTANSNAAAAVSTANTASSNASAAVSTANSAASDAATAISTANSAVSTANTASTTATNAVNTANSASSAASSAVSTANAAASDAATAVSTANTASSNATTAVNTANTAISTANAASAAVASAVIYQPVVNLAALALLTPVDGDFFELQDSTGADTDPNITGVPGGLVGAAGLTFRLRYDDPPAEYVFLGYFANDSETRYLKEAGDTMTGALGVTTGTAAAPSVFISGDPNTGIYSPGADQVAVATNGAQRATVDASGRILVGVTSNYASANADNIVIGSRSSGDETGITFGSTVASSLRFADDGTTAQGMFQYVHNDGSTADYFNFYTNSTEKLRITSAGLVGIGTSAPGYRLDVNSGATTDVASFTSTGSNADIYLTDSGTTLGNTRIRASSGGLRFITGLNARMTIDSSGRVGIGTTSPGGTLHSSKGGTLPAVNGTETGIFQWNGVTGHTSTVAIVGGSGASSELYFGDGDDIDVGFIRYEHPNNALVFATNTQERARIDSSGRLLVGTSTSITAPDATGFNRDGSLQLAGNLLATTMQGNHFFNISGTGPLYQFTKSNTSTIGSHTIVALNDRLGTFQWSGSDGTNYIPAAQIYAQVDGTPGANDMPGRLVFSTTADGASSPTERLRISQNGVVTIQNGAVAVIDTLTDGATITPDFAAGCNFTVTLGGNRTLANPTNLTAGQSGSIFVVQDATGSRTLAFGSNWDFPGGTAPTLSTAANAVDRIDYIVRSSTSIHTVFTANYS